MYLTVKIAGHIAKSKKDIVYSNISSVIRSLSHGPDIPVPVPSQSNALLSASSRNEIESPVDDTSEEQKLIPYAAILQLSGACVVCSIVLGTLPLISKGNGYHLPISSSRRQDLIWMRGIQALKRRGIIRVPIQFCPSISSYEWVSQPLASHPHGEAEVDDYPTRMEGSCGQHDDPPALIAGLRNEIFAT
ncbi:hypothetical protein ANN_01027 [Periplaneta americana]|uniref:Uncharacterized protein n=1 Tax=Periplaneta americana TaxID=6978 RepID=A0ABQ8TSK0_PERAM|nr:hypothetical protein ANN_01027 [Periplaneta americana]